MISTLLLSLLLQASPQAKASVSGIVVQNSGEPVAGATVTIVRTDAKLGAFIDMVAGDHPPVEITITSETLELLAEEMGPRLQDPAAPPRGAREAFALASLPIAEIHSVIVGADGSVAVVPKSAPPVTTDGQGRFTFDTLDPGTYKLMFKSNGFSRQFYGQRGATGTGIPIVLSGGQTINNVVVRLTAVSAVAGHVFDKSGQPLAGIPVQLFRFIYDENGKRKMQRAASAQTDDRGEYRMFYLSPGRYYMSAGNPPGQQNGPVGIPQEVTSALGNTYTSNNRIIENYARSYYPGTDDATLATAIEIPPGADLSGIDLTLNPEQRYRVRGRVLDSQSPQPPSGASVSLDPVVTDFATDVLTDAFGGGGFFDYSGGAPIYNSADGTFELRNVAPGSYKLIVSVATRIAPTSVPGRREPNSRGFAFIKVGNSDVDGLVVPVGIASSIAGRVRLDSNVTGTPPSLNFLRLEFRPASGASGSDVAEGTQSSNDDGTFLVSLIPGEYRLTVAGLPPGFYVKEARFGDVDILNTPVRIGNSPDPIEVVIASGLAQLDGFASDSKGQMIPGAQIALIPDNRTRPELFKATVADVSGHFVLSSLPPGGYRLIAWEFLEPFAFFDPALIKEADDAGIALQIAGSAKQSINVKALPAP